MLNTKKMFITTLLACSGAIVGYSDEQLDRLEMRIRDLEARLADSEVSAMPNVKGGRVFSKFDVEFYGQIYASFSKNSSGTNSEAASTYVVSKTANAKKYNESEMGFTFKRTRFGFNINGPEAMSGKLSGKLEMDLFGSSNEQGRLSPGIRHAYMKWENDDEWVVLAGQTTDAFVLVNPTVVNFGTLGKAGCIDGRRTQLRVEKGFYLNDDHKLTGRLAVARGNADATNFQKTTTPHLQGALVYTGNWLTEKETTLGISGVFGKEKYAATKTSRDYKKPTVWMLMGGFDIPLIEWISVSGSIFTGQNLRDGGLGVMENKYYVTNNNKNVKTTGGWAQLKLTPIEKWAFNLGGGIESTRSEDVANTANTASSTLTYSNMCRNMVGYANAFYSFTSDLSAGLEYSYMYTKYKAEVEKSVNHRLQTVVKFVF